ncbi:MAG: GSCFA domain-containing protein [Galbibacter orientalis]|uniref:GSCFA domain-containing protein n=1 Tax=Galbibacter orientalis TaxID=453852 RepID=UPI003001CF5B
MKLQTQIPLKPLENSIDYNAKVFLMGSCFVENIGEKFSYYKFQSLVNSFGIIFHPKAIENLISRIIQQKKFTKEDVFFLNERWHCFEVHSVLSNPSEEIFLNKLNEILEESFSFLKTASHIVFTLGTAWGYENKESANLVANCHKVPQKNFNKVLFNAIEIEASLKIITRLIKEINPEAAIQFTVSPVRHLKDGFIENQRSKAHLITAIHQIIEKDTSISYFPSYEIMMDELRDYRFYAEDMIHPNKTAINYIWEKFKETAVASSCTNTMKEVEKIQSGLSHRPFNTESDEFKKFQEKLQQKIVYLSEKHPHITF